jgi:hypothetical protein
MKQESRRFQQRERQLLIPPATMRQGNHPCLFLIMAYGVILPASNSVNPARSLSLLLLILAGVTLLWIPLDYLPGRPSELA